MGWSQDLPIAREWQQRPLESVYAVVFMDAIHYHVRSSLSICTTVPRAGSLYRVNREIPISLAIWLLATFIRSRISICARFSLVRC